jgi:hypothetical protein
MSEIMNMPLAIRENHRENGMTANMAGSIDLR